MSEPRVVWQAAGVVSKDHEILPGRLWMCGQDDVARLVDEVKPDVLINLAHQYTSTKARGVYVHWPLEDGEDLPDLSTLNAITGLICSQLKAGKRVVVHCRAGQNRSGLVAALVIMHVGDSDGAAAIKFLRGRNPTALTNPTFVRFIESIAGTVTVL